MLVSPGVLATPKMGVTPIVQIRVVSSAQMPRTALRYVKREERMWSGEGEGFGE